MTKDLTNDFGMVSKDSLVWFQWMMKKARAKAMTRRTRPRTVLTILLVME